MKRKCWVLVQPPYPPQGKGRQSSRVKPLNLGYRPPDAEEKEREEGGEGERGGRRRGERREEKGREWRLSGFVW